jgi:proline racemase
VIEKGIGFMLDPDDPWPEEYRIADIWAGQ